MTMSYWEAMTAVVTRDDARLEIQRRMPADADMPDPWAEFVAQHGDHEEYEGSDVVSFLGY